MNTQAQTQDAETENIFDENGQTVSESTEHAETQAAAPTETEEPAGEKYRIGDQEFATQKGALDYAQQLEADKQVSNAYQQGLKDALNQPIQQPQSVTPEEIDAPDDTEELYTNPKGYLKRFGDGIKEEARAEFREHERLKAESDRIWYELTERHPVLADFRTEVEDFVQKNQPDVTALISSKGRPAGYDYIATQLKSRFSAYASALKPQRELPNIPVTTAPTSQGGSVTPNSDGKKPLSFHEQIRMIRKRG